MQVKQTSSTSPSQTSLKVGQLAIALPSVSVKAFSRFTRGKSNPSDVGQPSTENRLLSLGLVAPPTKPTRHKTKKNFRTPRGSYGAFLENPASSHSLPYHCVDQCTLSAPSVMSRAPSTSVPRSGRGMAGLLDLHISGTRRDRTFLGQACSVCEEPLQHTLKGEKILQLSCGHVSHEACLYEYIKEFDAQRCPTCDAVLGLDSSRGGNLSDMRKLSRLVKANASRADFRDDVRSDYESTAPREDQRSGMMRLNASPTEPIYPERSTSRVVTETVAPRLHHRNDSGITGAPSMDYSETQLLARRQEFDVQSMETSLNTPRLAVKNVIPAPNVSIRSEFPTLTRSRQQQSLTCLVTVEVPERKWKAEAATEQHIESSSKTQTVRKPPSRKFGQRPSIAVAALEAMTQRLKDRTENWHGLDVARFGNLYLHAHVCVGKDKRTWQDLECYLFSEMLICVKEKSIPPGVGDNKSPEAIVRCHLKGSILIKKHLRRVTASLDDRILTLTLSVAELPQFHLQFKEESALKVWRQALLRINDNQEPSFKTTEFDQDTYGTDEDDVTSPQTDRRVSGTSSYGAGRSFQTAPTEYSAPRHGAEMHMAAGLHVPLDIVVVIPISSSMQGLKITLLRDTLRFMVANLGTRDRMGLVTFGSSGGGVPIVGMTSKSWAGWSQVLEGIRPLGQKNYGPICAPAKYVDGANVAMDLLMGRKANNPLSSILLISDSSTSEADSVDFVVSRAEAAKVAIHSFGLGLTHKPDTMIELSTRTKASYTYVKDWNALRECVAGCLGSLQSTSHQNAKLKLRLPEGSSAKFIKISGAMHVTKRATGKDAEAALGNLRFGDKRDILVQLAIEADSSINQAPHDAWESMVSGLEALGGSDAEESGGRLNSVEEVPLIQADLSYGDILREGQNGQLPRPTLLTITVLSPPSRPKSLPRAPSPPIPPHPHVVQRRMELLTSDMLARSLTLVSRGQHDRGHQLLTETRTILKGLGKGSLPPLPPPPTCRLPPTPQTPKDCGGGGGGAAPESPIGDRNNSPHSSIHSSKTAALTITPFPFPPPTPTLSCAPGVGVGAGIDQATMTALDAEIEASLEWIGHPAVFSRDSRKAVLQAIGVISSQRAYTFRTPIEQLWADRIPGVRRIAEREKEWREFGLAEEALVEEQ